MEKKMENEMETGGIWKGSSLDFGSARGSALRKRWKSRHLHASGRGLGCGVLIIVSSSVPTGMSPDTSDQTVGSAGSDRF